MLEVFYFKYKHDFIFDGIAIETGAGKVDIETLTTKKLYLDLGAGRVEIDNLVALDEAKNCTIEIFPFLRLSSDNQLP